MNRQVAALVLSIAVAVLGWLALLDRGLRPALVPILTAGGILLGLLGVVVRLSRPRSGSPEGMSATAMWRVAVTVVLFCVGLPVIFIVLASNSWSTRAVLPLFSTLSPSGRWLGLLEELLMLGVALLIVFVPDSLHARGRAARSLVPEWLAGFASVLTVAFILLLHFGGIAEANLRMAQMGVLSVVAFGVAVLLAPFYRIVAKVVGVVRRPWGDETRACRRSGTAGGWHKRTGGERDTGGVGGEPDVASRITMLSYSPSALSRFCDDHMPSEPVGVAGFEPAASSSRSQVPIRTASAAACLTWEALSVDVRWRPRLSAVIVTHLVTRLG
jgi:hypothetical protein